jgi:hypothetical protein
MRTKRRYSVVVMSLDTSGSPVSPRKPIDAVRNRAISHSSSNPNRQVTAYTRRGSVLGNSISGGRNRDHAVSISFLSTRTRPPRPSRVCVGLSTKVRGRRYGDALCPDSQLAIPNPHAGGFAHTPCTPPHKVRCRVDRGTRMRICRGDRDKRELSITGGEDK